MKLTDRLFRNKAARYTLDFPAGDLLEASKIDPHFLRRSPQISLHSRLFNWLFR